MPQFARANLEGQDELGHIKEYLSTNKSDSLSRPQAVNIGRGLVAETLAPGFVPNNVGASHGNAIATLVAVREGDNITAITLYNVSNAGSNAILLPMIWDQNGTRLAVAATNASTAFSTGNTSNVTSTLSTAYRPTADALVYVGLAASAAAGPRILGGGTPALNQYNRIGTGLAFNVTASLATSDATSVTWTAGTAGPPWAALS